MRIAKTIAGMLCLIATLALLSPGVRVGRADDPVAGPISATALSLAGEPGP